MTLRLSALPDILFILLHVNLLLSVSCSHPPSFLLLLLLFNATRDANNEPLCQSYAEWEPNSNREKHEAKDHVADFQWLRFLQLISFNVFSGQSCQSIWEVIKSQEIATPHPIEDAALVSPQNVMVKELGWQFNAHFLVGKCCIKFWRCKMHNSKAITEDVCNDILVECT